MSKSKAKGTAAETALWRWLASIGRDARRNPPAGSKDIGDLTCFIYADDYSDWSRTSIPTDVVIEVKHYGAERMSTALANGCAELEAEKRNAGTDHGVLVVRRPGKTDPGEWYAVRLVQDDPEIGRGR